jgi:hypothetical protein
LELLQFVHPFLPLLLKCLFVVPSLFCLLFELLVLSLEQLVFLFELLELFEVAPSDLQLTGRVFYSYYRKAISSFFPPVLLNQL